MKEKRAQGPNEGIAGGEQCSQGTNREVLRSPGWPDPETETSLGAWGCSVRSRKLTKNPQEFALFGV